MWGGRMTVPRHNWRTANSMSGRLDRMALASYGERGPLSACRNGGGRGGRTLVMIEDYVGARQPDLVVNPGGLRERGPACCQLLEVQQRVEP